LGIEADLRLRSRSTGSPAEAGQRGNRHGDGCRFLALGQELLDERGERRGQVAGDGQQQLLRD
jgi:hypothetical protein